MKLFKLLSLIIVALVIVNVTLTNRAVDQVGEVNHLSAEITRLSNDNNLLKADIARLGSLTELASRLTEAGFTDQPVVVALPTPVSVASR